MSEIEDEHRGLSLGAVDYITKPLRPAIVMARVRTHLELAAARQRLQWRNASLEAEVDRRECEKRGVRWLPIVYPGFRWDNLQHKPPGTTEIPRRGGAFLWEQFHALRKLEVTEAIVAMFDEVDEGTAIFKVTSTPPTQARFVGYEGLPSDWYLRLVGEGAKMLRKERPISAEIPIKP